jgi:cytochrome c
MLGTWAIQRRRSTAAMNKRCRVMACILWATLALPIAPAAAQLNGHGGPVRALAVSEDSAKVLSGSFDASAIL